MSVVTVLVVHVTDKDTADKIKKEGYICQDYAGKHPIGDKCTTFFYPLNGLDRDLASVPMNARLRGKAPDDHATYVIMEVNEGCMVGDLHLELSPETYKVATMPLKEYMEYDFNRGRFREPEVVCHEPVLPSKVLGAIPYSKMKEIFDSCPLRDKTECMTKKVLVAVK